MCHVSAFRQKNRGFGGCELLLFRIAQNLFQIVRKLRLAREREEKRKTLGANKESYHSSRLFFAVLCLLCSFSGVQGQGDAYFCAALGAVFHIEAAVHGRGYQVGGCQPQAKALGVEGYVVGSKKIKNLL